MMMGFDLAQPRNESFDYFGVLHRRENMTDGQTDGFPDDSFSVPDRADVYQQ